MTLSTYIANRQQAAAAPAQQSAPLPSSDIDSATRQAWSLADADWAGMTDQQRAWYRWNITKAPGFSA